MKLDNENKDIVEACKNLRKKYKFKNILVTRGEKGITLFNKNLTKHFISKVKSVFDVSGAGDTVVSVLATCINMKMDLSTSIKCANKAGGHVVSLVGTQPISYKKFHDIIKL
jgi:bifunctional ADP-heptose synthase (sugar kinase/adenylyltransferase)